MILVLTPGEPAGIGPDITIMTAQAPRRPASVAVADPDMLLARARRLGLPLTVEDYGPARPVAREAGRLTVLPIAVAAPVEPGRLAPANAPYVLECLRQAADRCLAGEFDALVTGPVHKQIINQAGVAFSGHTEFLAERLAAPTPVMMLANQDLRVALVTTHLPLARVAAAITIERVCAVARVVDADLRRRFDIDRPAVAVCGLNPHAGEGGLLGREEQEVLQPALEILRREGLDVSGPLPADTAFTTAQLNKVDAVLAMYHDQGLPVVKHRGWGSTVNITLGLPIVRTSVDHGTALDLAGSGAASADSLQHALRLAEHLAGRTANR